MLCISSVVHGVTVPKPAGHDGRALALRRSSRGPGGRRRAIHLPTQTGHHKSQQLKAWSPEGSTSPSIHARVIGLQAYPMPKIIFKTSAGLYVSASYTLGIDSKMATSLILFPNKARARSLSLSHPGPGPRRRAGSESLSLRVSRGSGSVTPPGPGPSCQWARPTAQPSRWHRFFFFAWEHGERRLRVLGPTARIRQATRPTCDFALMLLVFWRLFACS